MSIFEQGDPTPGIQGRSRRVGWLMLGLTGAIVAGPSLLPAPYVIDNPGPTYDTLGSVLVGSLIHIHPCRRSPLCRSRSSPLH